MLGVREREPQRDGPASGHHEVRERVRRAATIASPLPAARRFDGLTGVGFAQPNPNARRGEHDDRQQEPADRVEMDDRVERQPAEQLGRPVAEPVGRQGVGELVDREGDEQEDAPRRSTIGISVSEVATRHRIVTAGRRSCHGDRAPAQSRPSRSAFFASYSSALIAPRSRRSARLRERPGDLVRASARPRAPARRAAALRPAAAVAEPARRPRRRRAGRRARSRIGGAGSGPAPASSMLELVLGVEHRLLEVDRRR